MIQPATPGGTFLGMFTPGTPQWDAARSGLVVTATEIAAVLGLSPWQSRFSLWHAKAGLASPPFEANPAIEWGVRLEDAVATRFHDDHPEWLPMPAGTWRSASRPWQVATPDRLLYPITDAADWTGAADLAEDPTALLEIKTSPQGTEWGEVGSDDIPVYYRAQVLWQLDTLGLDTCHVAVLIGGCDYREYTVAYDPDEALLLRDAAQGFLHDVRHRVRPPIDGSDATWQTVKRQHPDIDDTDIEVPAGIADRYETARIHAASAADELAVAKAALLDAMGSARRAIRGDRLIAYRTANALQPARERKAA